MCGICGIVNLTNNTPPPDKNLLLCMMGSLRHRGPDSSGYYRDKRAAMGHTRLSIIDLAGGAQPLCNEDGRFWISFNGEIYNYIELAAELAGLGHVMRTKSDTEVIVHAYEQWGPECFRRFNGQWALAIWDRSERELVLSRDRLGIRPLYYTSCRKRLLFASEIKALFADGSVERRFDPAGLSEIFTFWCTVAPRTAFKDIWEVEPGNFAVLSGGKLQSKAYWSLSFPERGAEERHTEEENAELLRNHLIEATRLRFLRSDVPVGAYLSGGIDSSLTSAVIARFTNAPLRTFSIRFEDEEFDEGGFQEEMIGRLGTDHSRITVSYRDIGTVFPSVVWHAERPILRTAPAPLFLLSRLVREAGYKVVVTGEGSDEVLAGYDIYREARARRFLARDPGSRKRAAVLFRLYPWMHRSPSRTPAFARAFFGKSLDINDPGISHRPRWESTAAIKRMLQAGLLQEMEATVVDESLLARLPGEHEGWDPLSRAQWLEMTTLLSGYILEAQGDRMLMANSVEGRFPFLDSNFVDFANRLPARHKLLALDEKHLLKIVARDLVPSSIINRPKQPYRAPDASSFFFGDSLDWVDDLTSETSIKQAGIFDDRAVSGLLAKCRRVEGVKMSNIDNMRTVAVLSTMLAYHQFIKQDGQGACKAGVPEPLTVIDNVDT